MDKQPIELSYPFRNLLGFLILYLFISPFLSAYPRFGVIAHFILSVTLCLAVYTVHKQQGYRSVAVVLLTVVLVFYWLGIYDVISFSEIGAYLMMDVFFLLLIVSFSRQLTRSSRIGVNEIFATLCLYLIIGLFWGAAHALLYEFNPGSYAGPLLESGGEHPLSVFNYFSLITLTTVGYGDITPQSPGATALCQLEAIIGQFYTAVVVAWLVGNVVTDRQRRQDG
jgi:hypothetical protein